MSNAKYWPIERRLCNTIYDWTRDWIRILFKSTCKKYGHINLWTETEVVRRFIFGHFDQIFEFSSFILPFGEDDVIIEQIFKTFFWFKKKGRHHEFWLWVISFCNNGWLRFNASWLSFVMIILHSAAILDITNINKHSENFTVRTISKFQ